MNHFRLLATREMLFHLQGILVMNTFALLYKYTITLVMLICPTTDVNLVIFKLMIRFRLDNIENTTYRFSIPDEVTSTRAIHLVDHLLNLMMILQFTKGTYLKEFRS